MRVTAVDARLKQVPLPRGRSLPRAVDPAGDGPAELTVLVVRLTTVPGGEGLGVAVVGPTGRAAVAVAEDQFALLVVGADPRQTGRLYGRAKQAFPEVTRGGVEALAWSAVDIALWELKARSAGQPMSELLGGARDAAPAHFAETLPPGLSADRVVELARPALAAGVSGLLVGVNGRDPVRDANKLQRVREELGDAVWFGVCGHEGLDVNTALAFGKFLEEELDADLYADPIPAGNLDGLGRLAGELGLPVAAGSSCGSAAFADLVTRGGVAVLRPDINRVGGVTPMLTIAALAEAHHRAVMPSGPPAINAHLGCGLPAVAAVDDVRWFDGIAPVRRADGRLTAGR